ncbi:Type cbb3 cytochrome oxidase biogenesis protein CcoG [Methylophaga frappieri]|uniref:Type cbb3 cytochrome oxidase biogenesis protein CcoG n=1 Tax=Methylophaga frappieri (strain ATCC BAA-2434 / DSM 25690 / JAM7) TaxID=754477 RepID=I1YFD5_METFJ|nr:cytochrome c oxidase accessory protein CcoG [Methylophaga frappieri]AFJ01628.1 Type cbb3 cytochrome oxidase biogenesis protein CcoG [Methylophaga frappieri]
MSQQQNGIAVDISQIYEEVSDWHVNAGEKKVVAKRMDGRYRRLKWFGMSVWLVFFLGPYLRWNGQQAVLFDIPNRQFNFFNLTIYPQDIWMLSLTLLFFAILLAAVTSIAGRVFCGYFCFQTVWTDVYTYIETRIEGDTPQKAKKFKDRPADFHKVSRITLKHTLWLAIALLTGLSFSAWFTDAYQLWRDYFTLQASLVAWIVLAMFTVGTYIFAGFMREQVCFWLCPYARLQGVMYDQDTVLPAYDAERGEPRGKLKRGQVDDSKGSCIDCKVCVAVCPTGVDIRKGQQEGCITCGMCIDACDSIMDKTNQPRGLIRYASYKELHHNGKSLPLFKRPRVIIYGLILLMALGGVVYGYTTLSPTEFKVTHNRQPLFVRLSDGAIQNRYMLKMLNKTKQPIQVRYTVSGIDGAELHDMAEPIEIRPGHVVPIQALVRVPESQLTETALPLFFEAEVIGQPALNSRDKTVFMGPQ